MNEIYPMIVVVVSDFLQQLMMVRSFLWLLFWLIFKIPRNKHFEMEILKLIIYWNVQMSKRKYLEDFEFVNSLYTKGWYIIIANTRSVNSQNANNWFMNCMMNSCILLLWTLYIINIYWTIDIPDMNRFHCVFRFSNRPDGTFNFIYISKNSTLTKEFFSLDMQKDRKYSSQHFHNFIHNEQRAPKVVSSEQHLWHQQYVNIFNKIERNTVWSQCQIFIFCTLTPPPHSSKQRQTNLNTAYVPKAQTDQNATQKLNRLFTVNCQTHTLLINNIIFNIANCKQFKKRTTHFISNTIAPFPSKCESNVLHMHNVWIRFAFKDKKTQNKNRIKRKVKWKKRGDTRHNQIAIKTNELFIWFGGCVYMFYGPNIGTDINISFSDLMEWKCCLLKCVRETKKIFIWAI